MVVIRAGGDERRARGIALHELETEDAARGAERMLDAGRLKMNVADTDARIDRLGPGRRVVQEAGEEQGSFSDVNSCAAAAKVALRSTLLRPPAALASEPGLLASRRHSKRMSAFGAGEVARREVSPVPPG